jgi:hypothetical protein
LGVFKINLWQWAAARTKLHSSLLGGIAMDAEHYISYFREEVNHEIARLKAVLRNPGITGEEREVALAMLEFYEDARMTHEGSFLESMQELVPPRARRVLESAELNERGESTNHKKARAA